MYLLALEACSQQLGSSTTRSRTSPAPGRNCRHNEVYFGPIMPTHGFGVGAPLRYVGGKRELKNVRGLKDYLKHALSGESSKFSKRGTVGGRSSRETAVVQSSRALRRR